jgi:hypothetical protein
MFRNHLFRCRKLLYRRKAHLHRAPVSRVSVMTFSCSPPCVSSKENEPFEAHWLSYVILAPIYENSAFCPQSVCVFHIVLTINSDLPPKVHQPVGLRSGNECVSSEVRTEFLYII